MAPSSQSTSNPSESEIYDRQIRLWGADAQVKQIVVESVMFAIIMR